VFSKPPFRHCCTAVKRACVPAAQANFTLQAAIGDVDIRRGDLLSLLGAAPSERLQVQPLADPDHFDIDAYILASCAVLAMTECERTQPGSNSPVKVKSSCTHDHSSLVLILIRVNPVNDRPA
jgi:hypothetical protein